MRNLVAAASLFALAACGLNGQDNNEQDTDGPTVTDRQPRTDLGYQAYSADNEADAMASNDQDTSPDQTADTSDRPVMQAQVVLDRQGFGPGVIDGKMGMSTENALRGFQEANGLETTGELDEATKEQLANWNSIPATRLVTIPRQWAQAEYREIPDDPAKQAEMERLGYTSLDEKLAERFHTTVDVLKELNPKDSAPKSEGSQTDKSNSSYFSAGQEIRVPNVGADAIKPGSIQDKGWQQTLASLGVGSEQPEVARVVVSEKAGTLRAFDADDKLVAVFTVTTGSKNDPLPLGDWEILGVGRNPPFSYNPELFWDVPDSEEKQLLPPGPNGPVGVVWIDLSKEHYGIHGTPEPQTIGRAESHGCVRLTNWDAARLSQMVSPGTKVLFEA